MPLVVPSAPFLNSIFGQGTDAAKYLNMRKYLEIVGHSVGRCWDLPQPVRHAQLPIERKACSFPDMPLRSLGDQRLVQRPQFILLPVAYPH